MTVIVDRPPTVRRTHRRNRGSAYAELIADQVEAGEAVAVMLPEYVPGWWVTCVDRAAKEFEVYRDGGSMTVAWATVSQ